MKADARRVVLQLLAREHGFPTRAFPDVADKAGLDDRDRALAREILAGTIRMQRALDATFTPFCKKKKMDPMVRWTLRMGVYQMLYLDRIPAHAAVDATLRAASPFIRHAKGFANAILRSVERAHSESPQEFFEKAWCRASKGPLDRISVEHSFPTFLVERWTQEVGSDICLQRLQALHIQGQRCSRHQPRGTPASGRITTVTPRKHNRKFPITSASARESGRKRQSNTLKRNPFEASSAKAR